MSVPPARIVVIGGGFSGATFALHLARNTAQPVSVTVVEPRPGVGLGVAYASVDPAHRINVPATRMSALPDEENHFADWVGASGAVADDAAATLPDGRVFPRRSVFGRYVAASLAAAVAGSTVSFSHVADRAIGVTAVGTGYRVLLSGCRALEADLVVLATSHPPPSAPSALAGLGGAPKYVEDPWAVDALAGIGATDRVLIVGTGLTMADIVASLALRGHRGPIQAVSRRGLLSRGHVPVMAEPFGEFTDPPNRTALGLLQRVRRALALAREAGLPWQAVLDAVRRDAQVVWQQLDGDEQGRLLRHLRPFWDVHRYRVAPQVEAAITAAADAGRFTVVKGHLAGAGRDADGFSITVTRGGKVQSLWADAVVVATGPAHGGVIAGNPALASLARAGLVVADRHGLGLAVDPAGRAIGADGRARDTLLVAGPLARATHGELMGLPQVTRHAEQVAKRAAQWLAARAAKTVPEARAALG